MMDVQLVDAVAFPTTVMLLYFLGLYDKKYRAVPLSVFSIFTISSALLGVARLVVADDYVRHVIFISFLVSGVLLSVFVPVSIFRGMIGIGDVLAILATSIALPYPPFAPISLVFAPVFIPLSVIITTLIIYVEIRRNTIVVDELPRSFRRIVKIRASQLKNAEILTMYPVYIEGVGPVYDKVFRSNPQKTSKEILSKVDDNAVIYAVPY